MLRNLLAATAALSALALAIPTTALAANAGAASYGLQITGFVPTVCRAQLDSSAVPSQAGQVALGQMNEFCNDASGYEVWIDYSPNLAGDTLMVDGRAVQLSATGSTRIDVSNTAASVSKALTLDVPDNGVSANVSVRVVAL